MLLQWSPFSLLEPWFSFSCDRRSNSLLGELTVSVIKRHPGESGAQTRGNSDSQRLPCLEASSNPPPGRTTLKQQRRITEQKDPTVFSWSGYISRVSWASATSLAWVIDVSEKRQMSFHNSWDAKQQELHHVLCIKSWWFCIFLF